MAKSKTLCERIMASISFALTIATIVIGAVYMDDCPRERYIPIYLVVAGSSALIETAIGVLRQACGWDADDDGEGFKWTPCIGILGLMSVFNFAWFIAGCVWVYGTHGDYQSSNPGGDDFCHDTVFLFAFWLLNTVFIILGLCLLLGVSCLMCFRCKGEDLNDVV